MAGGFSRVRERALAVKCETMQMFCSNPRGWGVAKLDPEDVARFRADMKDSGVSPVFVHAPYLPNLAAGTDGGRGTGDGLRSGAGFAKRSVKALITQAERCEALGVHYLVVHVGKAGGLSPHGDCPQGLDKALVQVAKNLDAVLAAAPDSVMLLLENTAGMGSEVGYRFEQVAAILGRVGQPDRVGVVLDTAHAFEAGYELRNRVGLDATLREFDKLVGFSRLHLIHLNDSKTDFGSRVDRHWHIGKGKIGKEGMRAIVNHPLLGNMPAVMETPHKTTAEDLKNLKTIRSLVA